jgi:hypothetical protein
MTPRGLNLKKWCCLERTQKDKEIEPTFSLLAHSLENGGQSINDIYEKGVIEIEG